MSIFQIILITIVCFIGRCEAFFGTSLIDRPIVICPVIGAILGDLQSGIIMGGTLELAFIGAVSIGAYIPPDMLTGSIIGVSFAIVNHESPEMALALGLPIASGALILQTIVRGPVQMYFLHRIDYWAERGDLKKVELDFWLTGLLHKLITLPVIPLTLYLGARPVEAVLKGLPEFVSNGIDIAAGMIPALGFAMLIQMIINKKVAPFLFLGFFVSKYLGVPTTGVAIFAVILTVVMVGIEQRVDQAAVVAEGDDNEF